MNIQKITSDHFFWFAVGSMILNVILVLLMIFFAEGSTQLIGLGSVIAKGIMELVAYLFSRIKIEAVKRGG